MPSCKGRWMVWAVAWTVGWCLGCGRGDTGGSPSVEMAPAGGPVEERPASVETPPKVVAVEERKPVVQTPSVEAPRATGETPVPHAAPEIPGVLLPDALRQTCLVWVDDPMPQADLPDPAGQVHAFGDLFGEKLTVVFFWTGGSSEFSALAARTALEDLQKDVYETYAEKGVQVVAVNKGDTPEAVQGLIDGAGATFINLLDCDGGLLEQVAKSSLSRVYLLDGEGKILWLDLEFSEFSGTTEDNLLKAIRAALSEEASS